MDLARLNELFATADYRSEPPRCSFLWSCCLGTCSSEAPWNYASWLLVFGLIPFFGPAMSVVVRLAYVEAVKRVSEVKG